MGSAVRVGLGRCRPNGPRSESRYPAVGGVGLGSRHAPPAPSWPLYLGGEVPSSQHPDESAPSPQAGAFLSPFHFVQLTAPAPFQWGGSRVPPPPTPPGEGGARPAALTAGLPPPS